MPKPDPEVALVAETLRRDGLRADVVCWDADLDWTAYDLVVIRSPWDYFDRLTLFREWVARVDAVSRVVNPADVIRWNSHKGYLVELAARGVSVLPTRLIPGDSVDVAEQLAECAWDEVVIKPAVDGGARATLRASRDAAEARAHALALAGRGDVVVQPFAPQVAEGERSLVFFGGRFSHAVRKVPADGDYRVQDHHGGAEHGHEPTSAELITALAAMECAPARLTYARVDLVDYEGVPSVMELELIEPDLFLRSAAGALDRFVATLKDELAGRAG